MKYLVISQPKAGTYLLANLLQSLGMTFSNVHIDPGMYRVFHGDLENYERHKAKLNDAISAIPKNQFGVGHIQYNKDNQRWAWGTKKILITRNRKDILESAKRYRDEKGVNVESIINDANLNNIESWKYDSGTFHITFEEIINEDTEKIDSLQVFLFGQVVRNSLEVIKEAKNSDSLTKSSIR